MKNVVAFAAVAGLATAASAQSVTITFSASSTNVLVGEVVTWTVSASFTGGFAGSYFGTVNANWIGQGTATGNATSATMWASANPILGVISGGTAAGLSLNGVFAAQNLLFGLVDSSNPLVLGVFTATYTGVGDASYGHTDANSNPAYAVILQDGVTPPPLMPPTNFTVAQVGVNSDTVTVTPTPSALALLGLGGLVALRRRR